MKIKGDWVNSEYKSAPGKEKQQTGSVSLPKNLLDEVT